MVDMQQVWPRFRSAVDHLEVYERAHRPHSAGGAWVMMCMITTVDGSVSVQGRSGPLGGPADWAVLSALRGCADAVVVGAGTARAEDYGPLSLAAEVRERRLGHGQEALPLLAVVSARGALDPKARLFGGPEQVRLYLAGSAPPEQRAALAAVADVRTIGGAPADPGDAAAVADDPGTPSCSTVNAGAEPDNAASTGEATVAAAAVVADLAAEGRTLILLEGGPRLNASFAGADLIDEFCITRSPLLAPGGPGLIESDPLPAALDLRLDRLLVADGMIFARYLRQRPPHDSP